MNKINRFLSLFILSAFVMINCSDTGTAPVVEEPEIPSLEESVNFQTEVGTQRTNIFDSKLANDGIVILGSYKDIDSSCLRMKLFLVKVSFDGEELWRRKYDNIYASKCDQLELEITDTNGIAVFAATANPDDFFNRDYHVYKFSSVGDLMWKQTLDYGDLDIRIKGTDKGNGELVAYPFINEDDSYRQVTFDDNGNILEDIPYTALSGNSFQISETPSEKKFYLYQKSENSSTIEVYDKNLNPSTTIDLPFQVSYLNETTEAENGYFAQSDGLIKFDSNFEKIWTYTPAYNASSIQPIEIIRDKYVVMESRSFSPGNGDASIISVVGDGGQILSRTIVNPIDGFYPLAKKVLSRGNGDIILVYSLDLDIGVTIYQNEF